ncbi:hypothetical protein EBR21_11370, partial [bacterium]|nr:hypothetical protein [bacterium]
AAFACAFHNRIEALLRQITIGLEFNQMTFNQAILVSKLIMKYGGAFRAFTPNDINNAVQKTKEYSNAELEMQAKAMKDVFEALRDFLSEYRAATAIHSIEVPVVFVQGAYDLLTPASLTKSFVNGLKAPN